jgi:hypothetical protein
MPVQAALQTGRWSEMHAAKMVRTSFNCVHSD